MEFVPRLKIQEKNCLPNAMWSCAMFGRSASSPHKLQESLERHVVPSGYCADQDM